MAVDHLNPEDFPVSSPRISFSFNLRDSGAIRAAPSKAATDCARASDSRNDFEFRLSESLSSSADELFSDGKILAVPVKKKNVPQRRRHPDCPALPLPPAPKESVPCNNANTTSLDPEATCDGDDMPHGGNLKDARPSRSFWRFRRSSSLGSANSCSRRLCFLPIMPRSYSTGSSPPNTKQHRQRLPPPQCRVTKNDQKVSSSECFGSHYRQRARQVSPVVLNVPTMDMFGLSYLFTSRKTKNNPP
ncbi:uncharacterized protein LOC115745389 [Rhodamnia argentea]|uniref:Uncharacterized protein LOC115745389 n=1 Tax=Rhodamnia argentea TaxID=178133 RepID=A0A8B8PPQ9_9MYRT|nr:uncharacterized protein LOC115745389 [Rhodamnia argentea]